MGEIPAKAWIPLECSQELGKLSGGHFSLDYLFCVICSLDAQVTQTPEILEVQEGGSFTLKCKYSSQYRPYFWYYQLPGVPPSLILSISSQGSKENKGFVPKYLDKGKESQLDRLTAQLQDSGNYFCAVEDTVV
ncbi:putative T-cell receptor alpha chain V region 2B4 protein [Naja naja]|nr:putative T-cell receptor alpha chain V region 2B4 protein [Naja naja]